MTRDKSDSAPFPPDSPWGQKMAKMRSEARDMDLARKGELDSTTFEEFSRDAEVADLRAQVARLEKNLAAATVIINEERHESDNRFDRLESIRPLVRAALAERKAEQRHRSVGLTIPESEEAKAARVDESYFRNMRRDAADALPADVVEWAGEGE